MLGAIAGDIIGSPYEARPIKTRDFPLFDRRSRYTDDSVLTVATAQAILEANGREDSANYGKHYKAFGREYPHAGYGGMFARWLFSASSEGYGSFGNGSAMRVSPVGHAFESAATVAAEARRSAAYTHDHPVGIKGAQATALAVYHARAGLRRHGPGARETREQIRREISQGFDYDLSRDVDTVREHYRFDPTCQGTVPEAILCVLQSADYEDAVRTAVSLGGDSDTIACIAGGIAEALYGGIPEGIEEQTRARLPEALLQIVDEFRTRYMESEAGI
jgi:ADP-ribosylglycohydrolase